MAGSATLPPYAELHCHSHFSFLDGASAPDDLVARAVELGLTSLALTDHQGLYGAVRFSTAAEAAGLHPVVGIEIELLDAAVPDPGGLVVPKRRAWRPGRRPPVVADAPPVADGVPVRPRPERTLLPGHRTVVKEDHRGIGEPQRGPHLVLLARDADRLAVAVPDGLAGQPRGDEGRAPVHPGAARGAPRGPGRAVRVPRRRARATPPGRRPGGGAGGGRAVRGAVRGGGPGRVLGLRAGARAPPPPRRRLAGVGDRAPRRRAGPPGRRDERRPLRAPRGPRAPGRPDRDPPRPLAGRARGPPAPGRRVVPQGGGRPARDAAGRPGDGRGGSRARAALAGGASRRRRRSRPAAGWSSRSRSTASRASPCPRARRRSRTSRSCAGRAPGGATTR